MFKDINILTNAINSRNKNDVLSSQDATVTTVILSETNVRCNYYEMKPTGKVF
jgi:hypothetical protein